VAVFAFIFPVSKKFLLTRSPTAFYQKYKTEINQLLYELLDGTGLSISELFGDNWDNADPLAIETQNQNLLAWFAYEEIASRLRDFLEQE